MTPIHIRLNKKFKVLRFRKVRVLRKTMTAKQIARQEGMSKSLVFMILRGER